MPKPKAAAILLAGGVGSRLGQKTRKTNLRLGGATMLSWPLKALLQSGFLGELALVLHPRDFRRAETWRAKGRADTLIHLCVGGKERQDSVASGLASIQGNWPVVLVHDGARPFLKRSLIRDCVETAEKRGGALAAVPLKDSVKILKRGKLKNLDRRLLWTAQTPQAYRLDSFRRAHARAQRLKRYFTDEASLMEWAGQESVPVPSYYENFKITTPEDLLQAQHQIHHFSFDA